MTDNGFSKRREEVWKNIPKQWKTHWNIDGVANLCNVLNEMMEENEQLKKQDKINEDCYKELLQKYDKLKEENEQLKQLNIPVDEIEETVIDSQKRVIAIYYKIER